MKQNNQNTEIFQIESKNAKIQQLELEDKQRLESIIDTVKHIKLAGNSYSKQFFQEFSKILKKSKKLQLLEFQNIFVGRLKDEIPESLQFIGDSLIGKDIQQIDISDNAINPFGAKALSNYLSQAKSLKKFNIANCGLGPEGTETIAQSLEKGAPNLEVLSISRNRFQDKGAIAIGKSCQKLKNLKELHICQGIHKEGMVSLLQSLQNCKYLEVLDVRDNSLKEEASKQMAALIREIKSLHSINMSDCNMGEQENETIIEALYESKIDVYKLGFNYNELTSSQAKKLLDCVLQNTTKLEKLDIKGNDFKKGTIKYYKDKLQEKGYLKALSKFESDSESDDEDDESEISEAFSELKIQ